MLHAPGSSIGETDAGWAVGDERIPLGIGSWTDVTPLTSAHATAWPFFAPMQIIPAKVFIALTTGQAGAAARSGIYTNANGRPASLIEDLGELDLSATTGKRQFTTATKAVSGLFWVVVWLKNVATQATVRGPASISPGFLPIATTSLVGATGGGRGLFVAAAYPGSMPATAPALAAHTNASMIMATVEAG